MKELVVVSGKGGTGKTSLTAAFASLAEKMVLCDADVDAADLHLLANPAVRKRFDFHGGNIAIINSEKCSQCGICLEMCEFQAIKDFEIDRFECEGCGVCVDFCPEKAIDFPVKRCGEWFISDTDLGPMVHAALGIAEENSGRLVTLVRKEARKLAYKHDLDLIITDGPPGIGCSVIASMAGADALVVAVEPTLSGLHDMKRVILLARNFRIPVMICVNKYDLNLDFAERIQSFAKRQNITFLGEIPFDHVFTEAMTHGKNVIQYKPDSEAARAVIKIWDKIVAAPEFQFNFQAFQTAPPGAGLQFLSSFK